MAKKKSKKGPKQSTRKATRKATARKPANGETREISLGEEFTFDLQFWCNEFSLGTTDKPSGSHITSPIHLTLIEQRRAQAASQSPLPGGIPTDVFVWAKGEPTRRDVTKVGGLPYRPTGKSWPTDQAGQALTFVVQFRFEESKDIVPELQGDVLLVFASDEQFTSVHYEWYDLGLTELVQDDQVPSPDWEFVTCYGLRHRTVDYSPRVTHLRKHDCIYDATKIGGVAAWTPITVPKVEPPDGIPPIEDDAWRDVLDPGEVVEGRFLCSLGAIQVAPRIAYPFVNVSKAMSFREYNQPENCLTLTDMGIVHFFLTDDGEIRHWMQFG